MFTRYLLASLVAGLALGAQSAVAGNLRFYEGHGWLPQPPFSSDARGSPPGTVIAGPRSAAVVNPSPRLTAPAPYDKPGEHPFN